MGEVRVKEKSELDGLDSELFLNLYWDGQ